jgi:site-specific DNA-methyltransferase (adenine-specific)
MAHAIINDDCLRYLHQFELGTPFHCIFADPPDNIGLNYDGFNDGLSTEEYLRCLSLWLKAFTDHANIVWFSFNAKWMLDFGGMVREFLNREPDWECKPFVQTFTFGQNNKHDCGNGFRPLWRLKLKDVPLYPDSIKVESERQRIGDKRAAPGGRVPLDVWEFPRVTGNSKQRRRWHPTQLHEGLVERAIKLSTKEGDSVCDPFGGTGTTLRVCRQLNRPCTLIEISEEYFSYLWDEHSIYSDTRMMRDRQWC